MFLRFIWREMNRQRVSQEDVADRSGWSSSAMRKWRQHDRRIPIDGVVDVLDVLGYKIVIKPKEDE